MKAIVLRAFGPAENLTLEDRPVPEIRTGHALIRVRACGVGYRDVIDRSGRSSAVNLPIVLGHEFAGDVVAVGEGVSRVAVGDRVINLYAASCGRCDACVGGDERDCSAPVQSFGYSSDGGYADYVLVHERGLEHFPETIDYPVAATLMSAITVGFNNTVNAVAVKPGERVLVTGASGGVGSAAVQTAKLIGTEVWTITSSAAKVERLKALGADHVIVNAEGNFHKEIMQRTGGRGLDAAVDCVGNPTLNGSIRSLRKFGRVAAIGNIGGTEPFGLRLGYLIVRSIRLLGSENVTRESLRRAIRFVAEGRIKALVEREMPLCRAAEAHRILEDRGAFGRLVLIP